MANVIVLQRELFDPDAVTVMSITPLTNPHRLEINGAEDILAMQERVNEKFKAIKAKRWETPYGI